MNYQEFIQDCDRDLKAGQVGSVIKRLKTINTAKIPREFRLPLANLCGRCNLRNFGLRILSLQAKAKWNGVDSEAATPQEMAEYANLLMKIGSVREALKTLDTLNSK